MSGVWTYTASTNTIHFDFGYAGTREAAVAWAGDSEFGVEEDFPVVTEEYDGSTWSLGGDFLRGNWGPAGCGSQEAAISIGGWNPDFSPADDSRLWNVDVYDGVSWSEISPKPTLARTSHSAAGTQDACFITGGDTNEVIPDNVSKKTEVFDSVSWAAGDNMIDRRWGFGCTGTETAALIISGGWIDDVDLDWWSTDKCEEYDGLTFSAVAPVLHGGSQYVGAAGTVDAALSIGAIYDFYEIWTGEYDGVAWSTGGALLELSGSFGCGGAGTQDHALCIGGWTHRCEHYDPIVNDPVKVLFGFFNGDGDPDTFATDGVVVKYFDLADQTWHHVGDTIGFGYPMDDYNTRIVGCDQFCAVFDYTWVGDEEWAAKYRLFIWDYNGNRTYQDLWENTEYRYPYLPYYSRKLPVAVHNSGLIACIVFHEPANNWLVKVSTDRGATWKEDHPFTNHPDGNWMDEGQVIIDNNQTIWITYSDGISLCHYVYKSLNAGDSWSLESTVPFIDDASSGSGYHHSIDTTGQYHYIRSDEHIHNPDTTNTWHFRVLHSNDYALTWSLVNDEVILPLTPQWFAPSSSHTSNINFFNGARNNSISYVIDFYHSDDYAETVTTVQTHYGAGEWVSTYNLNQYIAYTESGGTIATRYNIGFMYSANNGLNWRFIESEYAWSDYFGEGVYVIPGSFRNTQQPMIWISM